MIRAFVAIELPQNHKQDVQLLVTNLQALPDSHIIRWVKPQAFHLTLSFLGDTDPEQIPEICTSLSNVAKNISPFECALQDLGAFPNWQRLRVLHLQIADPSGQLVSLQRAVESGLQPLGFQPERRA